MSGVLIRPAALTRGIEASSATLRATSPYLHASFSERPMTRRTWPIDEARFQLRGRAEFTYAPGGLRCLILAPSGEVQGADSTAEAVLRAGVLALGIGIAAEDGQPVVAQRLALQVAAEVEPAVEVELHRLGVERRSVVEGDPDALDAVHHVQIGEDGAVVPAPADALLPAADAALFTSLRKNIRPPVELVALAMHVNDPEFGRRVADLFVQLLAQERR